MGLLPASTVTPFRRRSRHVRHAPWSGAVTDLDVRLSEVERRIADLDRRFSALTLRTRMRAALAVSIAIHLFLIFAVGFKVPDKSALNNLQQPLEVVLVNAKTVSKPVKPDALAQASLDRGGNTDADRRAKSPLPLTPQNKQAAEITFAQRRVEHVSRAEVDATGAELAGQLCGLAVACQIDQRG